MTSETDPRPSAPAPRARRSGWRLALLIAVAGGLGVIGGAYWRDALRSPSKPTTDRSAPVAAAPKQLWTCGMHPQVIQDHPGKCPICHMQLTPLDESSGASSSMNMEGASGSAEPAGGDQRKIKYWWDPMTNPPYISDKPGKSPMGMDLVPVYEDRSASAAVVKIDPAVAQNMGLRIEPVRSAALSQTIRAVGLLEEAQPAIHDVNLRVSGWIVRLYANTEGMHLVAGEPLFDLYSPQLHVAINELILVRKSIAAALNREATAENQALYDAAVQKLELLGLSRSQVDELAKLERAPGTVRFYSPVTGHLTEKMVVEGAAVNAGERIMRIVDHSTLWLDAQIFEQQLPLVRIGQKAAATLTSLPGEEIDGEIIFIHPHVDPLTRTARVRIAIPNPSLLLKPGMYATVRIRSELSSSTVVVPREAIIDTGEKQIAFVSLDGGGFEPRTLSLGVTGEDGMVQVLQGLTPGESVVVSGQFLLDAESRTREAIQKYLRGRNDATRQPATQSEEMSGSARP